MGEISIVLAVLFGFFGVKSYLDNRKCSSQIDELTDIVSKLPDVIVETVAKSNAKKLTVKELNQRLKEEVILDENADLYHRYRKCPNCGSKKLAKKDEIDIEVDVNPGDDSSESSYTKISIPGITCEKCQWEKSEKDDRHDGFGYL